MAKEMSGAILCLERKFSFEKYLSNRELHGQKFTVRANISLLLHLPFPGADCVRKRQSFIPNFHVSLHIIT